MFCDEPWGVQSDNRIEILRVPPGGRQIECVCLESKWTGIGVHYIGNRCVACPTPENCTCDTKEGPRFRGYIGVTGRKVGRLWLLEFTGGAQPAFKQRWQESGTLRGEVVELKRSGERRNGRLIAHFPRESMFDRTLPVFEHTRDMLRRIYELRPRDMQEAPPEDTSADVEPNRNGRGRGIFRQG